MKTLISRFALCLAISLLTVSGLKAAEMVPDFTLKSATDDTTFQLSGQRGKYVALHFLLQTECPICARHTREAMSRAKELPDVVQVFIKPDAEADIRQWSRRIDAEMLKGHAIFRDPGASLAKRLKIPDGYQFHGQSVHYPALILLGPDGKEVHRHVGKNNSDRFSFDQLKKLVNDHQSPAKR